MFSLALMFPLLFCRMSPAIRESTPGGLPACRDSRFQFRHNPGGDGACPIEIPRVEADGANPRVAAPAVALANYRQVVLRDLRCPRIRAHRYLRTEAGGAHRNRVDGSRKEVIRDELVVALHVAARQVEENHAVLLMRTVTDQIDRFHVALVQGFVQPLDLRLRDDLREQPM